MAVRLLMLAATLRSKRVSTNSDQSVVRRRMLDQRTITVALQRIHSWRTLMDTILLSMLPLLAALVFILYQALRRVQCPDCGELLPVLYSPVPQDSPDVASGRLPLRPVRV
jgi:hypothetical protein